MKILGYTKKEFDFILKLAAQSLSDADVFDEAVSDSDLSDSDMSIFRERLREDNSDMPIISGDIHDWDDDNLEGNSYSMAINMISGNQITVDFDDPDNKNYLGLSLLIESDDGKPTVHVSNVVGGDNVLHLRATEDGVVVQNDCAELTPVSKSKDYTDGVIYESPSNMHELPITSEGTPFGCGSLG